MNSLDFPCKQRTLDSLELWASISISQSLAVATSPAIPRRISSCFRKSTKIPRKKQINHETRRGYIIPYCLWTHRQTSKLWGPLHEHHLQFLFSLPSRTSSTYRRLSQNEILRIHLREASALFWEASKKSWYFGKVYLLPEDGTNNSSGKRVLASQKFGDINEY